MSSYGTVNHAGSTGNAGNRARVNASEEDALLSQENKSAPATEKLRRHFTVDIDQKHGDLVLLSCYIITGFLDSCATAVWGSFVSMQTGNTVYFGQGLADPSGSTKWIKSGTSIAFFCLGSFCFSRFHRYCGPRKRWVLTASFVFQLLMIVGAALITTLGQAPPEGDSYVPWHVIVSLAMIAFQSSGQAVTSRVLKYGGLTSVVLTSIYCDLFSDAHLLAWPSENIERNRRAAAPMLLLVGAFVGGLWSKSDIGITGALWTAAVLKGLIAIAWLFWKSDAKSDAEEQA